MVFVENVQMKYKDKELHKYSKQELIELCERLFAELTMVGGTVPQDLKKDDAADWVPPKRVAMRYKGKR